MLNRLRYIVLGELAAQLHVTRPEFAKPADLVQLERQITPQEVLVVRRQRCDPQVGDAVGEVIMRAFGLAPLELRAQRQCNEPRIRRVAEHADRRAGIGDEKPRPLLVMVEHLGDAVGPAREQLGREPWLERLHRCARFEPGNAFGERHAQHRCPRSLVHRLDGADRPDARTDPVFSGDQVHAPKTVQGDRHDGRERRRSWPRPGRASSD